MKNLKHLILVFAFICCSCKKNNESVKSVSIEEAPIEVLEENITTEYGIDEVDLEDRKDFTNHFNINHTLILQKINELIELNQLKQQQNNFKTEIEQQILKLTNSIELLDSLPKKTTDNKLKYLSSLKRINDSTELIDFYIQTSSTKQLLTATILSSKKEIDGTIYNNQQVTFKIKE